jgi:hypothetical protein
LSVASYLLHHRHEPHECGVAFAAFKGHASPLRRGDALSSCLSGGHDLWWVVEADSTDEALALLPHYVAQRCTAVPIRKVQIP